MRIGVLQETAPAEKRVALVPESVKRLLAKGHEVLVESGAGQGAYVSDGEYQTAGAKVAGGAEVLARADILLRVQRPSAAEAQALREGQALLSLLYPSNCPELVATLAARGVTLVALEKIPRTTLAQAMDVLSSQASCAGYWAVLAAAERLPRYFPMLTTAAGTVTPARVLILGAGVAGLQAIATARRLGAQVEAFDVRKAVREQVESLGARFVEVEGEDGAGSGGYARETSDDYKKKQAEKIAEHVAKADVVVTTALIPGRPAPKLVTAEMVRSMKAGSVIVDLAAEQGGNVEGTVALQEVRVGGVRILGASDAASRVAAHSSQLFSRNVEKLLLHLLPDGSFRDFQADEIARGCVIAHRGAVLEKESKAA